MALDEMQDRLGSLNDIAVHENLTADFATDTALKAQAEDRSRRAFAAGVLMGLEDARLNSASARRCRSVREVAETKPFWK